MCENNTGTYVKVYAPYYIKGAKTQGNVYSNIMVPIGSRITIGEEYSFDNKDKTRIFIGDGNNGIATKFEINTPVIANNGK